MNEKENDRQMCPVCGQYRFETQDEYEICPICWWEDDPGQRDDPEEDSGANGMSLIEAREWWQKTGKTLLEKKEIGRASCRERV